MDMTEGPIAKTLFFYSLPLIAGNMMQQLYNTADSLIVSNVVGDQALAAVGSAGNLTFILLALYIGAASGAGILISQYYGSRDTENLKRAVHTTILLAVVLGILTMIAGLALSPFLLRLLGTPEDVMGDALLYLRIFFAGMVFNVLYNMAGGILNAVGNSGRSLIYLAVASVTNILLDLLFVAGLHLGVAGAALATIIGQCVSAVLALRFLFTCKEGYGLQWRNLRPDLTTAGKILRIGIPTGIQNAVIAVSAMLIQAGVNAYGMKAMAGFTAYMKVDGFNILPVMSFSLAATTFTGQNMGAGRMDRVKRGIRTVLIMGTIYTVTISIIMLTFASHIIGFFTDDPEVVSFGVMALQSLAPGYVLLSVIHGLAGAIRGSGHTIPPMIIILISLCLYRIGWITFAAPQFDSIRGVYLVYPTSFVLGAVLMSLYAWKGKWRMRETTE
jgi:putative MATE family efflux protein